MVARRYGEELCAERNLEDEEWEKKVAGSAFKLVIIDFEEEWRYRTFFFWGKTVEFFFFLKYILRVDPTQPATRPDWPASQPCRSKRINDHWRWTQIRFKRIRSGRVNESN